MFNIRTAADWTRHTRKVLGMHQVEFSLYVGLSKGWCSHIETVRRQPRQKTLDAIYSKLSAEGYRLPPVDGLGIFWKPKVKKTATKVTKIYDDRLLPRHATRGIMSPVGIISGF